MKLTKGINPVVRATGVVSAVAIVAGGVTFAALNNGVALADSSASTAGANLSIWNKDKEGGAGWDKTAAGFTVENLVPGEDSYSDPHYFYLKNESDAALKVVAQANASETEGEAVSEETAPEGGWLTLNGVTAENVNLKFTSFAPDCEENTVTTTLAAVQAGEVELPCNNLPEGAEGNPGDDAQALTHGDDEEEGNAGKYSVEIAFDTEEEASVDNLDLTFTGTVANDDDEEEETPPVEVPVAPVPNEGTGN